MLNRLTSPARSSRALSPRRADDRPAESPPEPPSPQEVLQEMQSLLRSTQDEKNGDICYRRFARAFSLAAALHAWPDRELRHTVNALIAACCERARQNQPPGAAAFLQLVAAHIDALDPFGSPHAVQALKQALHDAAEACMRHNDPAALAIAVRIARNLPRLVPGDVEIGTLLLDLAKHATHLPPAALDALREDEGGCGLPAFCENLQLLLFGVPDVPERTRLLHDLAQTCLDALASSTSPAEMSRLARMARTACSAHPAFAAARSRLGDVLASQVRALARAAKPCPEALGLLGAALDGMAAIAHPGETIADIAAICLRHGDKDFAALACKAALMPQATDASRVAVAQGLIALHASNLPGPCWYMQGVGSQPPDAQLLELAHPVVDAIRSHLACAPVASQLGRAYRRYAERAIDMRSKVRACCRAIQADVDGRPEALAQLLTYAVRGWAPGEADKDLIAVTSFQVDADDAALPPAAAQLQWLADRRAVLRAHWTPGARERTAAAIAPTTGLTFPLAGQIEDFTGVPVEPADWPQLMALLRDAPGAPRRLAPGASAPRDGGSM